MFECWPASTISYLIGLYVGWRIWGRRERDLRATVERYAKDAQAILKGAHNDGQADG